MFHDERDCRPGILIAVGPKWAQIVQITPSAPAVRVRRVVARETRHMLPVDHAMQRTRPSVRRAARQMLKAGRTLGITASARTALNRLLKSGVAA